MTTKHTIINGDSRHMSELKDQSVHLIITSPPYWQQVRNNYLDIIQLIDGTSG
ncbi:MAG: hypothetical protein LBL74_08650 [Bacteroidales bacterium]|jgi:DNA modification methylase|nr:hypothetical protein [Bacteroidales bacterium]